MNRIKARVAIFLVVLTVLVLTLDAVGQSAKAEEHFERRFNVVLKKDSYLPLEPLVVEYFATLRGGDKAPNFAKETTVTMISESSIKDLGAIDPTSESPIALPEVRPSSLAVAAGPTDHHAIGLIGAGIVLPTEPGIYHLRFFLHVDGQAIASETVRFAVEEPKGVDLKALRFLESVKGDTSFDWVWTKKDGVARLRKFIEEFRDSRYSGYARLYLGNVFLAKGELAASQEEFDKLKDSGNAYLSLQAEKLSNEVKKMKDRSNSSQQPN